MRIKERYWAKVAIDGECWVWTGAKNRQGYGEFRLNGRILGAHRVSYAFANGPIAEGMCVLHTCDNPSCVNPNHLFAGTQQDNMADKVRKGRQAKGEANGAAKFFDGDVRAVRLFKGLATQKELANMFGISRSHISNIHTGRYRADLSAWREGKGIVIDTIVG